MRRAVANLCVNVALLAAGCATRQPVPRSPADAALFAPVSMRIHPIFTQVKDWTGDGKPDGIEALLEFQDQFSDPTKAAGTAIFELYSYNKRSPDPRGERLVNPWVGSLKTLPEQQARWNRTSRTYFFQLAYPQVRLDGDYVLAAEFDTGTTRFFDEIVLEGDHTHGGRGGENRPTPATRPATNPTAAPPAATAPIAATGGGADGSASRP